MALAAGGSPLEAARFGNLVASVTIMKKGTGTASPVEVLAAAAE
jgi:sugar/nucleoside kinase (ribokinase family)